MANLPSKKICIISGEPSGDKYGALLARAFFRSFPDAEVSGCGGNLMREAGVQLLAHIRELSVSGFTDVLCNLPKILFMKNQIYRFIIHSGFHTVVFIDFPDFNINLARKIHRYFASHNVLPPRLIYFIPPQVWIWRKYRVKYLKTYFDAVIPLFEFEHQFYLKQGICSFYFGHPLSDLLQYQEKKSQNQDNILTVLLLPGSRRNEIRNILPVCIKSLEYFEHTFLPINTQLKVIMVIPKAVSCGQTEKILRAYKIKIDYRIDLYNAIEESDLVLVKPGTVNLEVAYFGKPAIVVYKTSWINWIILRLLVRTKFVSLINILAGTTIVKEFIQCNARPDSIAEEMETILTNSYYRDSIRTGMKNIIEKFLTANSNVTAHIADFILSFLKNS